MFARTPLAPALQTATTETTRQTGNVDRGRTIAQGKGGCLACHRIRDSGSHLGPDLSAIGLDRTALELRAVLLSSPPVVEPRYQLYRVTTRAGQTYTGRLMNQDLSSIQLLDATDRLRSFRKEDLASSGFISTKPMPSYGNLLNPGELDDLIAYLRSLKGIVRQ